MKQSLVLFAALTLSTMVYAGDHSPKPPSGPVAYGGGGGSAAAISASRAEAKAQAAALASLRSSIKSTNTANGGAGGGGGAGGSATALGGAAGNGGSVVFEGAQPGSGSINSTVYEKSAPSIAVGAPQQPLTSCRLSISLGGSGTSGSGAGGIPIGNDETCLAAARLALMERVGGFSQADKLQAVCKVEGMADTSLCKAQGTQKVAEAPNAAPAASSQAVDPIIAASGREYPSQPVSVRPFFGFASK